MKRFCLLLLATLGTAFAFSESTSVLILYNRNTPVNSDVIHFLQDQFARNKADVTLKPEAIPAQVTPGQLVLVLNTGLSQGIDRQLANEVSKIDDKSKILLLSIEKGSKAGTFETLPSSPATLGVDAVTSASRWEGPGFASFFGGKPSANYLMQSQWALYVLHWIEKARTAL